MTSRLSIATTVMLMLHVAMVLTRKPDMINRAQSVPESRSESDFSKFTGNERFFDSNDTWKGNAILGRTKNNELLNLFENREGPAFITFNIKRPDGKFWMTLIIGEEYYIDSPRIVLSFNLKMSRYDKARSKIIFDCKAQSENCFKMESKKSSHHSDLIDMREIQASVSFLHKRSENPSRLDEYDINDMVIDFSVSSRRLSLEATGYISEICEPLDVAGSLYGFMKVGMYFCTLLMTCRWLILIKDSNAKFAEFSGYPTLFVTGLLHYHCSMVFWHLRLLVPEHYWWFTVMAVISFIHWFFRWAFGMKIIENFEKWSKNNRNDVGEKKYVFWLCFTAVAILILTLYSWELMHWEHHGQVLFAVFLYPYINHMITVKRLKADTLIPSTLFICEWSLALVYYFLL